MIVLISLAVWRLTYMLTDETGPAKIFAKFRGLFFTQRTIKTISVVEPKNIIGEILDCFYCCSVWVALVIVATLAVSGAVNLNTFEYFLYTMATSGIAILLEEARRFLANTN